MKNWLPVLPGWPVLAIAMVPGGYAVVGSVTFGRFSSANLYVGPPLPLALGSPHCSTLMPSVVRRWHLVLSKNFFDARYVMLAAVQGALAVLTSTSTVPVFRVMVIFWVPLLAMPVVGG